MVVRQNVYDVAFVYLYFKELICGSGKKNAEYVKRIRFILLNSHSELQLQGQYKCRSRPGTVSLKD